MRNLTFTRLNDIDSAVMEGDKRIGTVTRFGNGTWAALATDGPAWTPYRRTRKEAVADMLAGTTCLAYLR